MNERRGNWYILTGLIFGIGIGLLYSWVISPVHYTETSPDSLNASFKDDYRMVIASAYVADGDIGRAQSRLELLGDSNSIQALAAQAQQILETGGSQADASLLIALASALEEQQNTIAANQGLTLTLVDTLSTSMDTVQVTPTPGLPTVTPTLTLQPTLTATPGITQVVFTSTPTLILQPSLSVSQTPSEQIGTQPATFTPTPTLGAPFALKERSRVCDQTASKPLLSVQINDASGNPVPGVKIQISWQDGQNSFFTGFMPGISEGYAEFILTPGVTYTLQLTDGGKPVSDLQAIECSVSGGESYWGGWYLVFQQPE